MTKLERQNFKARARSIAKCMEAFVLREVDEAAEKQRIRLSVALGTAGHGFSFEALIRILKAALRNHGRIPVAAVLRETAKKQRTKRRIPR